MTGSGTSCTSILPGPWKMAAFIRPPLDSPRRLAGSDAVFLEDALGDGHGGVRGRPTGVEGEMRNQFDELFPADTVVECLPQMEGQLVCPVERDQSGDRDQAPIARGKTGPFPDIPKQNGIRIVGQCRGNITERLTCRGGCIGDNLISLLRVPSAYYHSPTPSRRDIEAFAHSSWSKPSWGGDFPSLGHTAGGRPVI